MERKVIEKLRTAGVDPAVILDLILDDQDQSHAAPAEVTPEPAAAPDPEPAPAPAAPAAPATDPILSKLDQLIGTIQASNILRDGRGSQPTETVDDILAKMITPGNKEAK
jgi:hypothetical protein